MTTSQQRPTGRHRAAVAPGSIPSNGHDGDTGSRPQYSGPQGGRPTGGPRHTGAHGSTGHGHPRYTPTPVHHATAPRSGTAARPEATRPGTALRPDTAARPHDVTRPGGAVRPGTVPPHARSADAVWAPAPQAFAPPTRTSFPAPAGVRPTSAATITAVRPAFPAASLPPAAPGMSASPVAAVPPVLAAPPIASAPPAAPARKRRTWPFVVAALALLLIVIGVASNGGGSTPTTPIAAPTTTAVPAEIPAVASAPAPASGKDVITYEVTGPAKAGNITYVKDDHFGQEQVNGTKLPWSKAVEFDSGSFSLQPLSLVAQSGSGGNGEITCRILRNGQELTSSTSSGPYAVVTCSAS